MEHPKSAVYRLISQHKLFDLIITPKFEHKHVKEGNVNIFVCKITVTYKNKNKLIVSDEFFSKSEAEKVAYIDVLSYIDEIISSLHNEPQIVHSCPISSPVVTIVKKIKNQITLSDVLYDIKTDMKKNINKPIVLVDYENVSTSKQITLLETLQNMTIIKIAGFCSPMKSTADIIVRSNRNDAVDHFIGYMVGAIETTNPQIEIYVITRDKFASCLQDFSSIKHCPDVDDLLNLLN